MRTAKGDIARAIVDYDDAIELDPKLALAHLNRGIALEAKGNTDLAIADYDEAIRLDPKLASAYSKRGIAYQA
jgi:tetratricopeptide (TPR) repeat protein